MSLIVKSGSKVVINFSDPDSEVHVTQQNTKVVLTSFGPRGPEGPKGDKGDKGDPGAPGAAPQAYRHHQDIASVTWVVIHNLGYYPAGIRVTDTAGTDWEPGTVVYDSPNQFTITWSAPFAGVLDAS